MEATCPCGVGETSGQGWQARSVSVGGAIGRLRSGARTPAASKDRPRRVGRELAPVSGIRRSGSQSQSSLTSSEHAARLSVAFAPGQSAGSPRFRRCPRSGCARSGSPNSDSSTPADSVHGTRGAGVPGADLQPAGRWAIRGLTGRCDHVTSDSTSVSESYSSGGVAR